MDYLCYRVEEAANAMGDRELTELVKDVAELLHDREWYVSGDYGEDTWEESVRKFKQKWFDKPREKRLKALIEQIFDEAKQECLHMIGVQAARASDDEAENRALNDMLASGGF